MPSNSPHAGRASLDLPRVLAGPWAGQMLADYGADVIKVERPGSGDDTRAWGPPWWGEGEQRVAAYFLCANRGKRSLAIDIASPEGIARVRELAQQADILIENYQGRPAGQVRARCRQPAGDQSGPDHCSITGYGQSGPLSHKAGYDFAVQAEGRPDEHHRRAWRRAAEGRRGGDGPDDRRLCGHGDPGGAARARAHRQGRVIDASLYDVQVAMLANQASNQLIGRTQPTRMGNAHPNIVPYQVFPDPRRAHGAGGRQ